jgi:hypothetical protein
VSGNGLIDERPLRPSLVGSGSMNVLIRRLSALTR